MGSRIEKQVVFGLVSGGASTALRIFDETQPGGKLQHTELFVATSSPQKLSVKFRERFPVSHLRVINPLDSRTPEEYGETIIRVAKTVSANIVGQYGHTPLTPANVIAEFPQMINQHPGPVDPSDHDFGGKGMSSADRVHAARLLFVRMTKRNYWTDVTAQRVSVVFDGGIVLKRGRVEIVPDDTVESLNDKAKEKEYDVQIDTLHDFEEGTIEEQPPYTDLVLPHEIPVLKQARRTAQLLFPPEK